MNIHPNIAIVLREGATFRANAQPPSDIGGQAIGSVRFGELGDVAIHVQTTDVAALLALADACQEAARRLRALQVAGDITRETAVA